MVRDGAAEILSVGIVSSVGLSAAPTAAAVRAGISRLGESHVFDKFGEPLVMGLVRDEHLPQLVKSLADRALSPWWSRLPRLAAGALTEALQPRPPTTLVPLLLGGPESGADAGGPDLLELVAAQAGVSLDMGRSKVVPAGRAAGLLALGGALAMLDRREVEMVVVGGVDSYLHRARLKALDREGRLKSGSVSDGFIPGEGAAFLLLGVAGTSKRIGQTPLAHVLGVGLGRERGHMYSSEAYRGEGLASAFQSLFRVAPASPPVRCVYSGLNGESFWAKEWGVALIRSKPHFAEPLGVEHPTDCTGDIGAALGPMMLGLAALGLQRGYHASPSVVFCSSDREERAAVLIGA